MASAIALSCLLRCEPCSIRGSRRLLHHSSIRHAITNLQMPAMSPTMTEGAISSWKKQEGEAFSAGDILLEIETDKATIDVEAQDDGIMGKILIRDGAKGVPIGKVIALLAEKGDDISNLEAPKPAPKLQVSALSSPPEPAKAIPSAPSSSATPHIHSSHSINHSRPMFPSVHRLLSEFGITNPEDIKGTGVRGMLTKGDVLTYLGKASGPTGTFKESTSHLPAEITQAVKEEPKPLDGAAIRRLIVSTMLEKSIAARNAKLATHETVVDFDSIIADYLPQTPPKAPASPQTVPKPSVDFLDGLY